MILVVSQSLLTIHRVSQCSVGTPGVHTSWSHQIFGVDSWLTFFVVGEFLLNGDNTTESWRGRFRAYLDLDVVILESVVGQEIR